MSKGKQLAKKELVRIINDLEKQADNLRTLGSPIAVDKANELDILKLRLNEMLSPDPLLSTVTKLGTFFFNAGPDEHRHLLNHIGLDHVGEDYNLEKFHLMQRSPVWWISDFAGRGDLIEDWLRLHVRDREFVDIPEPVES
jgi:hypothetical protein